jgi:hypothetical protein
MDFELENKWNAVRKELSKDVGDTPDMQGVLFLIGVQEYGKGYQKFSKDEKLNLIHIAVCTVLEPYGYYEYEGKDSDGWLHFTAKKKLPPLNSREQQQLMKAAIIDYFKL